MPENKNKKNTYNSTRAYNFSDRKIERYLWCVLLTYVHRDRIASRFCPFRASEQASKHVLSCSGVVLVLCPDERWVDSVRPYASAPLPLLPGSKSGDRTEVDCMQLLGLVVFKQHSFPESIAVTVVCRRTLVSGQSWQTKKTRYDIIFTILTAELKISIFSRYSPKTEYRYCICWIFFSR